jgi:hypothetical protein
VAVDSAGEILVVGVTGSLDFPTATPFQQVLSGSRDAFVTRIRLGP